MHAVVALDGRFLILQTPWCVVSAVSAGAPVDSRLFMSCRLDPADHRSDVERAPTPKMAQQQCSQVIHLAHHQTAHAIHLAARAPGDYGVAPLVH